MAARAAKRSTLTAVVSRQYLDWADGLAGRLGMSRAVLIAAALARLAKEEGYDVPPSRMPRPRHTRGR